MITLVATRRGDCTGEHIGRRTSSQPGSPLAEGGPRRRGRPAAVFLEEYRTWLMWLLSFDGPERRELQRLINLARSSDLVLRCSCGDTDACHGQVIKELIERHIAGLGLWFE